MSLIQCQAPLTGFDTVTSSARSTSALRVTGDANSTTSGIPTPTVSPRAGVTSARISGLSAASVRNEERETVFLPSAPTAYADSRYLVPGLSRVVARQVLPPAPNRPATACESAARSQILMSRPELVDTVTFASGRTDRAPSGGEVAIWAGRPGCATGPEGAAGMVGAAPEPGAAAVPPPHPMSSAEGSARSTATARRVRT